MGLTNIHYLIPNRITQGYGLSPSLADAAADAGAKLLITVDNGISSLEGIKRARARSLMTIITDHHLAPEILPDADAIVNPNQPGCEFASKNLSGCGVIFYILLAVRAKLKSLGWFDASGIPYPNLANLMDLVAMSTVGDLVKLDRNNRALVGHGLKLMRNGMACPGINALFAVSGSQPSQAVAASCGFQLAPRINGAGRLEDMRIGVECLLAETDDEAMRLAAVLNDINNRRRSMQKEMGDVAVKKMDSSECRSGITLYDPSFHEGIVGLVATKIKDANYRPTMVFADAEGGKLKGSGRSIPGFHLRDALAVIQSMSDTPIIAMGGHSQACGGAIKKEQFNRFRKLFDDVCAKHLSPEQLEQVTLTDGELSAEDMTVQNAQSIEDAGPWGQGFEEPTFEGSFKVKHVRTMGADGQHARYQIRVGNREVTAVHFNAHDNIKSVGGDLHMTYRLNVNRWKNTESLQLIACDVE